MDKKQFYETYCMHCGTQRCEGIDTEWGEGCQYRWNLDGVDAAAEIKQLNDKIMELGYKLMRCKPVVYGEWNFWDGWIGNHDQRIEDATCSECGYVHPTVRREHNDKSYKDVLAKLANYCPNCGADMRGGHKNV